MDITDALAPTSDQLDAIELVTPRTFTIDEGSRMGRREDGKTVVEIRLVGFPRVWRPAKSMLDVLAGCWSTDARQWVGRSVTLYNDPEVTYGRDKVGGVRISHLSHIDGPRTVMVRGRGQNGKKIEWKVRPLDVQPATHAPVLDIDTATDVAALQALWRTSDEPTRARIQARVAELRAGGVS
jgi:hypothetical protein